MDTYENHQAFNRHLSIEGFRVSTGATKPSVYITEVKLRRAVRELTNIQVEDIFDNEMSDVAIKSHREKLINKIESVHHWQLMKALNILLSDGNHEAIVFISRCKKSDKEFN
jgi:hypothetical protein